jgi:nitroreductase
MPPGELSRKPDPRPPAPCSHTPTSPNLVTPNMSERILHDVVRSRFSPYVFASRSVEPEKLVRALEAARLTPSSFNEQPWRFVVGFRGEGETHDRIAAALVERNRLWAEHAPVLVLVAARTTLSRNERPNRHAWYDTGAAVMAFVLQTADDGLAVHQMGGFGAQQAAERLGIPEPFEPVVALALGYVGDPSDTPVPEEIAIRDGQRRPRRHLCEIAFGETWGRTLPVVADLAPDGIDRTRCDEPDA